MHQRTSSDVLVASYHFVGLWPIVIASHFLLDQTDIADSRTELPLLIPDNEDWNRLKELFLNRTASPFALLTFSFHYLWRVVG